jgi:hypothetical protein
MRVSLLSMVPLRSNLRQYWEHEGEGIELCTALHHLDHHRGVQAL